MKSSLKRLLAAKRNPAWYGGAKCMTCKMAKIDAINKDIREFFKAKKAGHPMPWAAFVREYLEPEYKTKIKHPTILLHVRRCLDIEA